MRFARTYIQACKDENTQQGNNSRTISVDIDFNDTPQKTLIVLSPGDFIKDVYLEIEQAFDNNATISIGFPANNTEIMDIDENRPDKENVFHVVPFRESATVENLNVYIQNAPTIGAGRVVVEFGEI